MNDKIHKQFIVFSLHSHETSSQVPKTEVVKEATNVYTCFPKGYRTSQVVF